MIYTKYFTALIRPINYSVYSVESRLPDNKMPHHRHYGYR